MVAAGVPAAPARRRSSRRATSRRRAGRNGGQRLTARLIGRLNPTAVLPLGDLQHEDGLYADFRSSYHPTWGRFFRKTRPVPENHEYHSGARGYFRYFGKRAHPPGGYYSFNLGRWHLIALNSSDGEGPSYAQLAGSVATFGAATGASSRTGTTPVLERHEPRFEQRHGVVLGDARPAASTSCRRARHNYERFMPMLPGGRAAFGGTRQFVVGTGGKGGDYPFRPRPMRTSQVRRHGLGQA